ncbi:sushi, von Willebrand factor type A, EGF and pentraxin domain-containing protein 1, partial [Aplysia californica]|uniref:Sushi, von Willebrand factor type A, EGF and pentraxin domain-containing protein 1 n=1 Tax=Aplysia californica TaxID=6500 RepID=A0ABM1A319_APLCA
ELIFNLCDVANPCQGVGSTCTDAGGAVSCSCGAGYSGPYCQTKDVSCSSTSCENGAVCSETSTGIICSCPRGYAGSRCEQDIDDCLNNNCPAGAQCVDQVDGYICQCLENRVGADCSKVVSSDFDVVLSSATAYQSSDYQRLVQPINRRAFTVSAWVRYTRRSQPATVLSLLGLNSADDFSNPQEILRLESDRAVLEFGSFPTDLTYNADVTDGFWHHVVLTWDSNQGAATVYIDGQQANSVTYGTQQSVRPYGWLVLGGVYDSASGRVDQSGGMTGRVSRVYISDNALSSAEVAGLVADTTQVPNGAISGYTVAMATGSTAPVDHNSDISSGLCFSASNCRSIDSISSNPQFTSCPDDQVLVSPRVATPTWTTPSASSAPGTVVRTTTVSGASEMGWGTMGVAYASLDQEGNADVCTFKVYNRRTACNQPTSVAGTSPRCSSVGGYLRCDAQCPTDQKLTQGAPVYYSCGPGSMFDTGSRVLNFTYPACTACTTPSYDFHLRVNFTVPGSPSCG